MADEFCSVLKNGDKYAAVGFINKQISVAMKFFQTWNGLWQDVGRFSTILLAMSLAAQLGLHI